MPSVVSPKWLYTKAGHPERSLPRFLRQTESKDLHLGMFECVNEFLKHYTDAERRNV